MSKKPTIITLAAALLIITSATFSDRVFASSGNSSFRKGSYAKHDIRDNGVGGVVESIGSDTITIKTKDDTTYSIDVSGAKLLEGKDKVITLSDIKVGDHIFAQGTVSGTSVTATTIFHRLKGANSNLGKMIKKFKKEFQGVVGVVTSVNGNSITVTGKDNLVYVVDASDANIKKGTLTTTASIAEIKSGDRLFVRGAVTGTTVVATDILDGKIKGKDNHKQDKK